MLAEYAPYFLGVCAFYLLPLLFSRRAKCSAIFAGRVVSVTAVVVFVIVSALFPLGAGLVGPITLTDYLIAVAFYVLPSVIVLLVWVWGITLAGTRTD